MDYNRLNSPVFTRGFIRAGRIVCNSVVNASGAHLKGITSPAGARGSTGPITRRRFDRPNGSNRPYRTLYKEDILLLSDCSTGMERLLYKELGWTQCLTQWWTRRITAD